MIRARALWLLTVIGVGFLPLAATALAADVESGKGVYLSRCAFCHGESGKGDGPAGVALKPPPTNLAAADFWQHTTPDAIKSVVENGKPGTTMLAFKGSLSTEQIDDLVAYVATFKPH